MPTLVMLNDLTAYRPQLEAAAPGWDIVIRSDMEAVMPHLLRAEAFVCWNRAAAETALKSQEIRWIQSWGAGVNDYPLSDMKVRGIWLTNASGVHGPQITESAFAMILAFARGLHRAIPDRMERLWRKDHTLWEIHGQTIGILGTGAIGSETARIAKAFSMRTLGMSRSGKDAAFFDAVLGPDRLDDLLAQSDYVVNALPLTAETEGLMNADRLAKMKPSACYISVGRGQTTDQAALVDALSRRAIAFAGLDVVDPEPLPPDSPLWGLDNVIITPHISGQSSHYNARAMEIFLENLRAYVATGKPVRNVVDLNLQY